MQADSSSGNLQGGTQNVPLSDGTMSFINMVKGIFLVGVYKQRWNFYYTRVRRSHMLGEDVSSKC
jgi:hypothetical protein